MRRYGWKIGLFLLLSAAAAWGAGFGKAASGQPQLIQQGPQKMWCGVCGMNLKMFYKTSHAVVLKNGEKRQYCSIRCLAADWKNISDRIDKILVIDAETEKLIDAQKAHYVVGSKVRGTMSMTSKIAFGSLADAKAFQKRYGGKITDFKSAFKMATDALGGDTAMISKKKKMKIYPMGKKIYKAMCRPVEVGTFGHINELKAAIKERKLCKPMREKQLQAVALYLWDVVGGHADDALGGCGCKMGKESAKGCARAASRKSGAAAVGLADREALAIDKRDKCPVCGMFVYKYPKWTAFIRYMEGDKPRRLVFDGVKDMMKFYLDPARWGYDADLRSRIRIMTVRDYYTLQPIPAKAAWYVIGSDIYGPMGHELIPFATRKAAESFMQDHHGRRIVRFDEIDSKLIEGLDG